MLDKESFKKEKREIVNKLLGIATPTTKMRMSY